MLHLFQVILFFLKHIPDYLQRNQKHQSWSGLTDQFFDDELESIRSLLYEDISASIAMLERTDPVVVLRVLAEIMLNEGIYSPRLKALLSNDKLNERWSQFMFDDFADKRDLRYSTHLLWTMSFVLPKQHKTQRQALRDNIQELIKKRSAQRG